MEILYRWIDGINDVLWSYLLVALLLGCAVWFTLRTRGVQFRMLGEMAVSYTHLTLPTILLV